MSANLQLDSQGRLVHLLTTEGLPRSLILQSYLDEPPSPESAHGRTPA